MKYYMHNFIWCSVALSVIFSCHPDLSIQLYQENWQTLEEHASERRFFTTKGKDQNEKDIFVSNWPANQWIWSETLRSFEFETHWLNGDYFETWWRFEDPRTAWLSFKDLTTDFTSLNCGDLELHCRFAAFNATYTSAGVPALASYCDSYCGGIGFICRGDAAWDRAHRLPEQCTEDCQNADLSTTLRAGLDDLKDASMYYYYAASVLMQGLTWDGYPLNGRDHNPLDCMQIHEDAINLDPLLMPTARAYSSTAPARYEQRITYAIERFQAAHEEAVRRILARADAGYGRGLNTTDGTIKEWYDHDEVNRTMALNLLVGDGPQLFPCTIDTTSPGMPEARNLFNALGGSFMPNEAEICRLADTIGLEVGADCNNPRTSVSCLARPAPTGQVCSKVLPALVASMGTTEAKFWYRSKV